MASQLRDCSADYVIDCPDGIACHFDPADHPTIEGVITAFVATIPSSLDVFPSLEDGFEVYRGETHVATVHRDGASGVYVAGPPFDRTRGMPPHLVAAFDKLYPGLLDK